MAETWSKLTPLDSANASEGPARIRFIKTAMATALGIEHTFDTATLSLTHNLTYSATEPAAGNENRWFYDSTTNQIKRDNGTTWEAITPSKGIFAAGTKTAFCQAAAPTGWTKDVTYNDKMLRVVSGAGGAVSGTWAFTTDSASHSHTVTSASISASHDMVGNGSSTRYFGAGSNCYVYNYPPAITTPEPTALSDHNYSHNHADLTVFSHDHTSDGTFRPQYVDVIICTKS